LPSLRAAIKATLAPDLPDTWDIYAYDIVPTVKTHRTALVIRTRSIVPTPEAPGVSKTVTVILSLIESKTDPVTREDALEEKLQILTELLDEYPDLVWTSAEKVLTANEQNLAYDITLTKLIS
jgi:hypothetical protein